MLSLRHAHTHTHTYSQTSAREGRRLQQACKRPPGVTYSLFTNREASSLPLLAVHSPAFVGEMCRDQMKEGTFVDRHLCSHPACLSHFTAPLPDTQTNYICDFSCPRQCWTTTCDSNVITFSLISRNSKFILFAVS